MESNDRRGDSPQPTGSPVRVGRFDWERLMLATVPHPQNFKLLPLGVFMSADGGRARPGNTNLAMLGPHEKTWAKLLRWAVAEGWLVQVERGGARRGAGGATVVRASVYAAAVPQEVWERRAEVLGAPPFRSSRLEGSAEPAAESLKGAIPDPMGEADSLKGAPTTPFNGSDASTKGASGDSLPGSMKGAPGVFEGSDPHLEGSVPGFEGSAQTLPHHVVVPSRSSSSSTSTTVVAEVSSLTLGRELATEGGGGVSPSEQNPQAEALVDALDYRGVPPKTGTQDRRRLIGLVAAALDAGWTEQDLKTYLDLRGAKVDTAVGLYRYRLSPKQLPDAETYRQAQERPLEGTDALAAGWGAVAASFDTRGPQRGYRPSDPNAVWDELERQARNGERPDGWERVLWCGDLDCDEVTRTHQVDIEGGLKELRKCVKCHPKMRF